MSDFVILFVHLITTSARLAGSGGVPSVVAESVLEVMEYDRVRSGWYRLFLK